MTYTYRIEGMTCDGCVAIIRKSLMLVPGVKDVEINRAAKELSIASNEALSIESIQNGIPSTYKISKDVKPNLEDNLSEVNGSKIKQLRPLFLILGYISIASTLLHYVDWNLQDVMLDFMGLFFLVFSFFKILDIRGFANTFMMYDPIAKKAPLYGFIYPFLEIVLAMMFFFRWQLNLALILTIVILGFTTIGVVKVLLDRKPIKCACLGTVLDLPMTEATFIENILMLIMAITMLLV